MKRGLRWLIQKSRNLNTGLSLADLGSFLFIMLLSMVAIMVILMLAGCVSPQVTVEKNVKITILGERCSKEQCGSLLPVWIHVEYTTKSELDTKLEVEQDIKPETTVPLPGF